MARTAAMMSAMLAGCLAFATASATATAGSPVPLFMWAGDSTFGGRDAYVLDPVKLQELSGAVLPAKVAPLPEVVVAYVVDRLGADEVADRVRDGHLASLQRSLHSAASSVVAPYTYRPAGAAGLGPLAAALAELTNRTRPGGAFRVAAPATGTPSQAQADQLAAHVHAWKPLPLSELPAARDMFSNGVVDVLAVLCGPVEAADAAVAATESALASVGSDKYVSILTAAAPPAAEDAAEPTRVVHLGGMGGARKLLMVDDEGRRRLADAADAPKPDFVYGSADFVSAFIFMLAFMMVVTLGTVCLMDIQTPTQYWTEDALSLGKVDE